MYVTYSEGTCITSSVQAVCITSLWMRDKSQMAYDYFATVH